MTDELKLRMTEIARKWMRPDSEAAPEFYWGDFYDCVAEIMGAAGASEGQAPMVWTNDVELEHVTKNGGKEGCYWPKYKVDCDIPLYVHPSSEIAALRERIKELEASEGQASDAQIGRALISTGLYDRMNDVTGGDREYRMLVQELIALVDPILDAKYAAIEQERRNG